MAFLASKNPKFNGQMYECIVVETVGSDERLLVWDDLSGTDKARFTTLFTAYGGDAPLAGSVAGWHTVDFGGTVVGTNSTGLTVGTAEVTDIDFTSHTIAPGDYFLMHASGAQFYVWFDVDATGVVDPAPGGAGLKVDILSTDTPAQIAGKVQVVIDGSASFSASVSTTIVTVTNVDPGDVVDASDVSTGVSITVTTQGVNTDQTYTGLVNVDGTDILLNANGGSLATFDDVINYLNDALSGYASAAIDAGNITITSDLVGQGSSVTIRDENLFRNLTGFVSLPRYGYAGADTVLDVLRDNIIEENGDTFESTYSFMIHPIGTKPKIYTSNSNVTYWNGTSWVRFVDDAAI